MLPPRILALDVGKVRIGVALTDPLGLGGQPLVTIHRKHRNEDLRSILRLVRKHEIAEILVGNPLYLSGDLSAWTVKVQQFAADLRARTGVRVTLVDERLSTRAAHEILDEAGYGKRDRKSVIDQVAAVVILNTWLEHQALTTARSTHEPANPAECG